MRSVGLFAIFAGTLVSGCVSVQQIALTPTAAEALRGRQATIALRDKPDFAAFTPGAAVFGAVGGAATIVAGNNIVKENNVEDPAPAIARTLAAELAQRYGVTLAPDTVHIGSDDVQQLAKRNLKADLLLDVRTINWSYVYYPTSWGRYRVLYTARVRLIDMKRPAVIAEGACSRIPDDASKAPTQEELLANGAQRLKGELITRAQECLQEMRNTPFAFAGPALSLAGATAPGAAPAQAVLAASLTGAARVEAVFWESIKASANPADFRTYLEQYPDGMFAAAARERLGALEAPAAPVITLALADAPRNRLPREGDTWTYKFTEIGRAQGTRQRDYEVKVAEVSGSKIVEHFAIRGGRSGEWAHSPGAYLVDLGASVFSPYLAAFQDLSAERAFQEVALSDQTCRGRFVCEASAKVVAREVIKVPAGSFETVKVRIDHGWRGWRAAEGPPGNRELYVWYAPAVKRAVKFSSRLITGRAPSLAGDFDLELVRYKVD